MSKNRLEHISTILAEKVIVGRSPQTISAIEIISSINVQFDDLPKEGQGRVMLFPINCRLLSLWYNASKVKTKDELYADLIDPEGLKLAEAKLDLEVPKGSITHSTIMNFDSLPVSKTGMYVFNLYSDMVGREEVLGKYNFHIEVSVGQKKRI